MSFRLETEVFDPSRFPLEESLYHNANGYLGVRNQFEEGYARNSFGIRGSYINGFYDIHPIDHPEKLYGFPEIGEKILNVTDVQGISLTLDGLGMTLTEENVSDYKRGLDMALGESYRRFAYAVGGKRVRVETNRLASFARKEVFAISYKVTALDDLRLALYSSVDGDVGNFYDPKDPRVSGKEFRPLAVVGSSIEGTRLTMESETESSKLQLHVQVDHHFEVRTAADRSNPAPTDSVENGVELGLAWDLPLKSGDEVVLEKIAVFRDSRRYPDRPSLTRDYWGLSDAPAYSDLAREQHTFLENFWKIAGIEIDGDDEILLGLRTNMFHLLQSAPHDSIVGVPAKGLSGEGYEGHFFWDSEIYMLPFFVSNYPEAAANLLKYRFNSLPGAREHARSLGHVKGAAFPWRTITGRECSAYYPSGSAQYHINADIAYAVASYWRTTGDDDFLRKYGAEILFETARIWLELGNYDASGNYHVNTVTGPDEYTCLVDDNYYTNAMAAHNLFLAAEAFDRLKTDFSDDLEKLRTRIQLDNAEIDTWRRAADRMTLLYDAERDLTPQDSSFLKKRPWDIAGTDPKQFPLLLHYHHMTLSRFQVCKQADTILAYILLDPPLKTSTVVNSYRFYEKITTHDSSLSYAAFAIKAADLGDAEKAYDYFAKTAVLDLEDSHHNTKDGIHAANMGGSWMALVWGFGGYRLKNGELHLSPKIPRRWRSLTFRITFRGRSLGIRLDAETLRLTLLQGAALDLYVYGEKYRIDTELRLARPT